MEEDIKRCLDHMLETSGVRKTFWQMDREVDNLSYGIQQGDDAVIVGNTVMNMEGPYPLKIGRKTGLIHSCSDIVVMGAKPLYALNSMQVNSVEQAREISEDIKKQSTGVNVPVIGGNTQLENELEPCVSFTVVGELAGEAIADAGVQDKDKILMLGEVVEGEIGQRAQRARVKFNTFLEMLEEGIKVHAAKDASRGGWFGNLTEMAVKSRMGYTVSSVPFPHITRYMGTYLIALDEKDIDKTVEIAARNKCPVVEMARIHEEQNIKIGKETVVDKEGMIELFKNTPYKKPRD